MKTYGGKLCFVGNIYLRNICCTKGLRRGLCVRRYKRYFLWFGEKKNNMRGIIFHLRNIAKRKTGLFEKNNPAVFIY